MLDFVSYISLCNIDEFQDKNQDNYQDVYIYVDYSLIINENKTKIQTNKLLLLYDAFKIFIPFFTRPAS